jgi:outer membrane receptor for ferrienterochelin and colicins
MPAGRWGKAFAVGLACGAFALPLTAQSNLPDRSVRLEGRVLALESGSPVGEALVRLLGTPLFTFTDDQGRFHFTGLERGDYVVVASAAGFRDPRRADVTVEAGGTASVEIVLQEAAFELPALVVTASRGAEGFGETTASVDIVTGADIQRRSAVTVDEALRFASGVIFNAQQMDIRGANGLARGVGSRVLMMVDGHRFLSGTTGAAYFEAVPIMGVERIEVVKGPSSTLYGSNALGGVVNVIREPIPPHPETTIRAHLGVYDSPDEFSFTSDVLNYQGLDLRHARRLGRVGFFGEGGRKTSDGYRQNGGFERDFVHGGFSVFREEGLPLVEMFGLWSQAETGEFFQWADPDRPLEVVPEELGDRIRRKIIQVGATATPVTTEDVLVQIRGGVFQEDSENHFHDSEDYHISTRYSLDAQASLYQAQRHVVTLGIEGAYTPVKANILGRPKLYDLAAYAQEELRLDRGLRTTAGIRVDFHDTDSGEAEFNLNPKVGIVFSPSHRLRYRASVSRGYRAPSAIEQFVSSTQYGFRVVPNPELKGESAWTFEVGVAGRVTDWAYLDGGLFQTNFDDLIEPAPVPGGDFGTFQFRNVAEARIRGVDASARFGLVDDLFDAQVNYVFLDTEDERTGDPLPYRSRHNLTISADYGPIGVDLQHRTQVERVLAYPLDPREDITVVGLRLGFRLAGVEGQLKLNNLFQEMYVDVQERNLGPSRRVQLTLQSSFFP